MEITIFIGRSSINGPFSTAMEVKRRDGGIRMASFQSKSTPKWLLNLVTWGIPMFFLMGIPKVTGFFAGYTHQNMSVYSKYCFLTGA